MVRTWGIRRRQWGLEVLAFGLTAMLAAPSARAFQDMAASKEETDKQQAIDKEEAAKKADAAKQEAIDKDEAAKKADAGKTEALKKDEESIKAEEAKNAAAQQTGSAEDEIARAKREAMESIRRKQEEARQAAEQARLEKSMQEQPPVKEQPKPAWANGVREAPSAAPAIDRSRVPGRPTTPNMTPPMKTPPVRGGIQPMAGNPQPRAMPGVAVLGGTGASAGGTSTTGGAGAIETPTLYFATTQPDPDSKVYRLDYKDTPWPDVLNDVARLGGLTLLGDTSKLTETVSIRSTRDYSFTEVLHLLNSMLLERPWEKRIVERDGIFLKIWPLPDRLKRIPPEKMFQSFEAFEAAHLDSYDMALVYMDPPSGWTPYQIIDQFRTMFDDYYGTQVEGNRIQLTGLVRDHMLFREVIGTLANRPPPGPDQGRTQLVRPLKTARAVDVQNHLRQMYPIQPPQAPRPGVSQDAEQAKQTMIIADIKNNSLWIKAPPQVSAEINEVIDKLDTGPQARPPVMERIAMVNANGQQVAAALKPIFAQQKGTLQRIQATQYVSQEQMDSVDVDIFPDMASNGVILMGTPEGIAWAKPLIRDWDVPDTMKDHLIIIKNADANAVATVLLRLFPPGNARQPGSTGTIIQPESSERLVVVCEDRDFERIQKIVEQLDVPPTDEETPHFVELKYATPSATVPVLQQITATGPVRQMRMMVKGQPGMPMQAGGGQGPRYIPDDASKMLVVICQREDWERLEPIIKDMDDRAGGLKPEYVTIALKNANAEDVVAMLDQMYPATARPGNPQMAALPQATHQFFADAYNNVVKVYASRAFIDEITPLVELLDVKTSEDGLTVIKLVNADAADVAQILVSAFGGGPGGAPRQMVIPGQPGKPLISGGSRGSGDVKITPEPVTNSLLIIAPPKEMEQIKDLVAQMDAESEHKSNSRVVMYAENRPSAEIAETLKSLAGTGGPGAIPGKPMTPGGGANGKNLLVVADGNRVILDGPRDEVAKAVQMFGQIDVVDQQPMYKKYMVSDAEEVEKAFRTMMSLAPAAAGGGGMPGQPGKPVMMRPNASAEIQVYASTYDNTLTIAAMPKEFPKIDLVLQTILNDPQVVAGTELPVDNGPFFVQKTKHQKAWKVAYTVEDLVQGPGGKGGPKLDEGPDEYTILVRNCKPADHDRVVELIKMFDVPEGSAEKGMLTIDTSDKISPQVLAKILQKRAQQEFGRPVELVDLGLSEQVQVVDIHEGDEVPPPAESSPGRSNRDSPQPCILPASLLDAVRGAVLGSTGAAGDEDLGEPIDPTWCPICHQSPCVLPSHLLESVSAIGAGAIGQAPHESRSPETQPTRVHNHPVEPETEKPVEAADLGPSQIIYDKSGNKIIIRGVTDEEQERFNDWIDEIIGDKAPTVYRVFPLKYADVNVAAQLLTQVFTPTASAPQIIQQPQQGQPQMPNMPGMQPGGKGGEGQAGGEQGRQQPQQRRAAVVQAAPQSRIKVVPDPRTKSLYVTAPLTDIPVIVDILRQIDRVLPPSSKNLRIFTLKNLEATQVVDSLREVLGLNNSSSAGGANALFGGGRGRNGFAGNIQQMQAQQQQQQMIQMQGQQGPATIVESDNVKLTAESQTNTIIAQAPEDTLDLIDNLIKQLEDETNTTKQEMRRVPLQNARASDVASVVREIATNLVGGGGGGGGGRFGGGRFGGNGGGGGGRSGSVTVQADARTNSIVLAGQVAALDRVEKVVKDMDIPSENGSGIKQFPVKGDADKMANNLRSLFPSSGGAQADIVITSDATAGMLLVKAPAAQMTEIEKQITEMDSKVQGEQQRRSIKVALGDAEMIATNLQAIYADARNKRGAKQTITIKGVKSNNTIYVTGADDDMFAEISATVEGMDSAPTGIQVRSFPLKFASAIDVEEKLTGMMAKAMTSGNLGNFKLDLIGVVPDARTNSLIVTGGPLTFMLIDDVLKQIDVKPSTPVAVETRNYQLPGTANANEIANNINALFAGQDVRHTGVEAPKVTANSASNMVIVAANATQHEQIKTSIIDPISAQMGSPLQDYQVKVQFARADEIKTTLEEFMNKWRQARGNKPQDAFTVTADPNSNMLLLNCSRETKAVFDKQLAEIDSDVAQIAGERRPKAYVLKYANPQSVQAAINAAFQRTGRVADRDQVGVSVDTDTKTAVVLANELNQKRVQDIVEMMDVESGSGATQDFIYTVKDGKAVDMATLLNNQIQRTRVPVRGQYPVNVVADEATNKLVIRANQKDYDELMPTIAALDVPGAAGRITKSFSVKYVAPWTMANIINQQFQSRGRNPNDQVMASFEDGTMSIIVSASERNMAEVENLITSADKQGGGVPETRFIQLKFARADEASNVLNNAIRAKYSSDRQGRYPITITADVASNNLIVTAKTDNFPEVEQMISGIDVQEQGGGTRERKIYKLVYADPGSVSNAIRQMFQQTGRNPSPKDMVYCADDWTTNSVIVSASKDNIADIDKIVTDIDKAGDTVRQQHIIEVANTSASDVARSLQDIFNAANQNRRGRTAATIRAIEGTTKIAAYANNDEFEQIKQLIRDIDVEGGRAVHTVTMPELVPAKSVADTINELYSANGRNDGIKAKYHEPTNTLLVNATESEFAKVKKQVIDVVSQTPTIGALKIFKFPLKFAVADEVAKTLQDFFDKKAGVSRGGRSLPPWMGGGGTTQQREDQVSIVAEPTSNTLLCYCTDTTKDMIEDLIKDIDADTSENNKMEMVALKYMDAADMLDILTEYLRVAKRTPDENNRDRVPWWFDDSREKKQDEKTILAGDMRLKAVESMNAIIVAGKPEGVADTVAKIKELDQPDEGTSKPVMIKIANGNASVMADTLTRMFEGRGQQRQGSGSSYQQTKIVADEATNQLLVTGKRSDVTMIEDMAKSLDSQMSTESSGPWLLQVPTGQVAEDLARMIQDQLNNAETDRRQTQPTYKPSLVRISADVTSNALIVSGSKAKFDEVKGLVDRLVAMGPSSPRTRVVIPLNTLTPSEAKQLLEQLQDDKNGSTRRTGSRGDADWRQGRQLDRKMQRSQRSLAAATLPALFAQIALGTAMAQTPAEKDAPQKPVIATIRPRSSNGSHPSDGSDTMLVQAKQPDDRKPNTVPPARFPQSQPAPRYPNAATQTGKPGSELPAGLETLERMRANTQPAGAAPVLSDEAKEALRRRLSGGRINVTEAGPNGIIVDASEEDIAVLQSIIKMLDTALPQKRIEYVPLKNAQARTLAQTLSSVFASIQQRANRPVKPEDKVDIVADPGTNGLYISATDENMQKAMELIRQNESAASDVIRQTRTIQLKNRRVAEAGEILKKMVATYLRQKGLPADAIGIETDPQTNSIFVTAGETDLKFVEQIVEGLDVEIPTSEEAKYSVGTADIMVVPLRIADADKLGTLLNQLLTKAATGDTPMKDFIRKFRLLDENGHPIADVDLTKPVVVFGEPESNSLIIASTKENCLIMKQVALAFDKEPARAEVTQNLVTLVYADATEVADKLTSVLTDAEALTQRPGKSDKSGRPEGEAGNLVFKAVIKADPRTNQLVIVGRPDAVKILSDLAASLDVKGLDVMPFALVSLEYANATSLETALTTMMTERADALPTGGDNSKKAEKVVIKAEPRSNSLIIAARKERMDELRGLIAKLDVPASALVDDIRTITLKKGNATEMAEKLKSLWEDRQKQRQGSSGSIPLEVPAIVADTRSNSLIVAASKGDYDAIAGVVAKIEALEMNPMANLYIVRLQFNSASQLAPALTALFQKRAEMRSLDGKVRPEDQVAIEVDEVTNTLIVVASRENIEVLKEKVAELDKEMGVPGQVEFFVCTNVDAARVKSTIDDLFGGGSAGGGVYKPGATGEGQLAQKREKVTVTVDDRANLLIVSASPENMALIHEVYMRMNSVQTPWDAAITKLIRVEHGDAVRIAAQLQEHFDKLDEVRSTGGGQNGSGNKSGFGITVFADERSNRLVIGGTKDGIDRAVKLVSQLDVSPGDYAPIRVYGPLKNAPVTRVAEMLDRVFQQRNQGRTGGNGPQVQSVPVTVEANQQSNTLLISASNEDHGLITSLIDKLDTRSALTDMVRLFTLKQARADRIKEILDDMFQTANQGQQGSQSYGVTVDNRTNSVLVVAPQGELENLAGLIDRLDTTEPVGAVEVGVFVCDNEDAKKMVDLLNQVLTGAAASGGGGGGGSGSTSGQSDNARPVESQFIKYEAKDRVKGRETYLAMWQNVRLTYNERTNSVIAIAPPASLKLIGALVRQLDRIEKKPVMVKVFPLNYSDATKMIDLLEKMFAQDQSSQQGQSEFQSGREFQVENGTSSMGGVPTMSSQGGESLKGTFGRPKTTFSADERTNSIVVAGWPDDINVAADIIEQLDSRTIQERDNFVYTLINATAPEVQTALDSFFQGQSTLFSGLGDSISPQQKIDQEVSVVAHEESNQLIVSVSPRYKERVLSIIEQLDLPPPQVMVQVMIAEVTMSDRFEMGLEFALQDLRFSETAVPGGNGVLQSSHFDVVGGTDLGAAGSGLGGASFTITGEDFNFLVRALQADSRLEVIQNPMIMCQDNQTANINIGQKVPFVRGSSVSGAGQITSQVEYEDIGIKLDVEPHINPDGWVYMVVKPEISSITDSTINIGNGVLAPIFNSRTAETSVAVKDGETVVIGGLITNSEQESENKVPFLGDIPGLGILFRTTSRSKDKSELLIALTPRIVRTVEDGRRMSREIRDQSNIITDNMKQSPLFQGLRVHPESVDQINDIETPPEQDLPNPAIQPPPVDSGSKPQYGPTVPRYGPLPPVNDSVVRGSALNAQPVDVKIRR